MASRRDGSVSQQDTKAAELILGASRQRLLGVLLLRPGPELHLRGLGRLARVTLGLLQRELRTFEQIGLIERLEQGRTVLFRVRRDHPLVPALRALLLESVGGIGVWLAQHLSGVDGAALVYRPRDSDRAGPLVLQVVSEVAYERWAERVLPLEEVLGRMIFLRVLRAAQLREPVDLNRWHALPLRRD